MDSMSEQITEANEEVAEQSLELPRGEHVCQGTTFLRTCFNGLNVLSGIGLITMPYAVSRGGWVSLGLLLLMAGITCYTGLLLIRCMNATTVPTRTYPDVGFRAFGKKGKITIAMFLYLELYLVATAFLIMEADNLISLFPHAALHLGKVLVNGKKLFTILAGVLILPTVCMNNLRMLSYISACGFFSTYIIIGSMLWIGFGGVGFSAKGEVFVLSGLPTTLSLYAFCYAALPVFPSLYSSMRQRSNFSKVLLIVFSISTINYVIVALLGYLMFGMHANSQVTLNFPASRLSSQIAIYTVLAVPIFKYALIITPVADAIEKKFPTHWKTKATGLLIKILLLLSTIVVALVFPYFGTLMTLVGAILNVTLSIIFPCVCYLKIFRIHRGWEIVIIGGAIVMAVIVGITGTYVSIKELMSE